MLRNRATYGCCSRCGCPMPYSAPLCWDCAQVPEEEPDAGVMLVEERMVAPETDPAQAPATPVSWAIPPTMRCTLCGARLLAVKPAGADTATLVCWACRCGHVSERVAQTLAAAVGADPRSIVEVVDPCVLAMADEIVRENELENLLAPRYGVEASGDD